MSIFKKIKRNKKITSNSLYRWNVTLAILHGIQAVIVLLLAKNVTFPINVNFLTLDSLSATQPSLVSATQNVFNVNLAYLVAAFFAMSSIAHALLATKLRNWYERNLKNNMNRARWFEYSVSASTMLVAISVLSGIYDLATLVGIFALTAVMNLCGLLMEVWNEKNRRINWLSFIVGCISGIVPWLMIAIYFWAANVYGSGNIPTFVYFIYGTLFLFFNCFAINMYLQYRRTGKWKEYLYGERVYMLLSLFAKSALAWQVFFGALRP